MMFGMRGKMCYYVPLLREYRTEPLQPSIRDSAK